MINLSVIIPAHNEATRIIKTLRAVNRFLTHRPFRSEILIIENGSTDNTADLVDEYQNKNFSRHSNPTMRMIMLPQGDKGQAVAAGMLAAAGQCRYMADADLSTPIWCVEDFIYSMKKSRADLVIGHRRDPQAQSLIRKIMSSTFCAATSLILGPGIRDTQAGFKLFSAKAAELIFPLLQINGWAFDVEVLYLAKQMGLEIQQLPIPWESQPDSKVKLLDPLRMLVDLVRIKQAQYEIKA